MPQTPDSAATSYLSAADALRYFDAAFLGGLVADDGSEATAAQLRDATTEAGQTFQLLLDAAAGDLEASCVRGKRYTRADLQALAGVSRRHRDRVIASLAVGAFLWRRDPSRPPPPAAAWAEAQLAALESGAEVFAFAETEAAGAGADVVTSTPADVAADTVTGRARRLFGRRAFEF